MRKINTFFLVILVCGLCSGAFAAITNFTPKKASSVAVNKEATTKTSIGNSLLPMAMNLMATVSEFKNTQQQLTAECEPSSSEINFVNEMIKEWAIAGGQNPFETGRMNKCTGVDSYESTVRNNVSSLDDASLICYDSFPTTSNSSAIWDGYPKAAVVEYCTTGDSLSSCNSNNRKKITNLWTLFDMVEADFSRDSDYTKSESKQRSSLKEKADKCSPKKIAAKRMETMSGLVKNTINSVGQPTNSVSAMEAVGTMMNKSGVQQNIGGLSEIAGSLLNR